MFEVFLKNLRHANPSGTGKGALRKFSFPFPLSGEDGHGRSRFRAGGRDSLRACFSREWRSKSIQKASNPSSNSGGNRCSERAMLELDHFKMWCRGGKHSEENFTLRCRRHNQAGADGTKKFPTEGADKINGAVIVEIPR